MVVDSISGSMVASCDPGGAPCGGGDAASPQAEQFAQLLASSATGAGQQPPLDAQVANLQAGSRDGFGEDVLGALRGLGQTISKMESVGTYRARTGPASHDLGAASTQPPALPGPAERNPGASRRAKPGNDVIDQAMAMANDALGQQAQLYKVMMDFTLVQSSAESLNKALKTLLTQGGG